MKRLLPWFTILLLGVGPIFAATNTEKKAPAKKGAGSTLPASTERKKDSEPKPAEAKTAPTSAVSVKKEAAPNVTIAPTDLVEFATISPRVQQLITAALALPPQQLTYKFGSADPANGGMDCSGTIYYVLRALGWKEVPRDSAGQYEWVRRAGGFEAVISKSATSFEFAALRPGDLLFWTGTYQSGREIPISHVMLYLGTEKKTKQRVMFGASDGRSYQGVQRWGVSVFDFKMPKTDPANPEKAKVDFVGYGPLPGGKSIAAAALPAAEKAPVELKRPAVRSAKKRKTGPDSLIP